MVVRSRTDTAGQLLAVVKEQAQLVVELDSEFAELQRFLQAVQPDLLVLARSLKLAVVEVELRVMVVLLESVVLEV